MYRRSIPVISFRNLDIWYSACLPVITKVITRKDSKGFRNKYMPPNRRNPNNKIMEVYL